MAENRGGKNQRLYYLTRGQLFVLGAGFAFTTVVVFLLGILIGRGIEERKLLKKQEPLAKIPVQPSSRGSGTAPGVSAKEEITFYDTLTKAHGGEQKARVEPPKKVKPVETTIKPPAKETKPVPAGKTDVAAKKVKEKAGTEKVASNPEVRKKAAAEKAHEAGEAQAQTTKEGVWAVQVNAYPHEQDAKDLAKKLKDKGYDAYVVSTEIKGITWYRVRVGRLATREEAQELQDLLKRKENFTKSITTGR